MQAKITRNKLRDQKPNTLSKTEKKKGLDYNITSF